METAALVSVSTFAAVAAKQIRGGSAHHFLFFFAARLESRYLSVGSMPRLL